jgi:MFS family permease
MRIGRLAPDEKMARKAGLASFVGTTVEWYDFYIFGTASALVFADLFFSETPPAVAVALSFATFWIGFLARPIGAIVFGHLGDRIGRKRTLIATLMLMGFATVGIGMLPTYASIGVLAPILLTVLRMVQGLAVGGEWGGAVLIATEHAKTERTFLFGAFAQQGSPAGRILATLAFLAVSQLPEDAVLGWAWRIPFLASAVLVIVGLVIRVSIEESPALVALRNSNQTARVPLVTLFAGHTKAVLLGVAAIVTVFVFVYARDTFALSWATSEIGISSSEFLSIILIASVVQFFVQPIGAVLATRWGPRRTVTLFLVLQLPTLPLMFALVGTGSWALALVGVMAATLPEIMVFVVMAGMLAQAFPAKVRYTGISTTYALAGALGGSAPLILQVLNAVTGSIVLPVVFTCAIVIVSLISVQAFLTLTARKASDQPMDPTESPAVDAPAT